MTIEEAHKMLDEEYGRCTKFETINIGTMKAKFPKSTLVAMALHNVLEKAEKESSYGTVTRLDK